MDGARKKLAAALERSLQRLAQTRGEVAAAIEPIIKANLESGRIDNFLDNGTVDTPAGYVTRVADCYEEWHEHVYRLQVEQDATLWEPFLDKLQAWAYNYLRKKGFPPNEQRLQLCRDCAADAGAILANLRFPYDVHFERWAYVVLQHTCLRQLDKIWNPMSIAGNDLVALDKWEGWLQNLKDQGAHHAGRRFEQAQLLLQALEQLSLAQQQFILLYYTEQKTYTEIALIMGKTKNALYKSHFDAINNLRKILGDQPDIYE